MKKSIIFSVAVLLVLTSIVSCGLTIGDDGTAKSLATISFSDNATRALSASINTAKVEDLYWRYAAIKSGNGPAAGATYTGSDPFPGPSLTTTKVVAGTEAAPETGLGDKIPGFSIGNWTFYLYGYVTEEDCKNATAFYAFSGSATNQTLQVGVVKNIYVEVNPDKTTSGAEGKLYFSNIDIPKNGTWYYSLDGGTTKVLMNTNTYTYLKDGKFSLEIDNKDVGTYDIELFGQYDGTETRSAKIKVSVYRGLTTTISGSVDDLQTAIQFNVSDDDTKFFTLAYDMNTTASTECVVGDVPRSNFYEKDDVVAITTSVPERKGYVFKEWNTKADGTGTSYDATSAEASKNSITITANTTLYAQWNYAVLYDGNGATGGTVPTDTTVYKSGDSVTVLGNTGSLVKTATNETWVFLGWTQNADGKGKIYNTSDNGCGAEQTFDITGPTTLYAKWDQVKGVAAVTGTTGRSTCSWTVLWYEADENGKNVAPKWADFNVGSTINDYAAVTTKVTDETMESVYSTVNVGGLYAWLSSTHKVNNPGIQGTNDTAKDVWGSNWKMSTRAQMQALIDNCDWVWCDGVAPETNDDGHSQYEGCTLAGYIISGKGAYEDVSIFLPAAGLISGSSITGQGVVVNYWSSTKQTSKPDCFMCIKDSIVLGYDYTPNYCFAVRAVLAE